MCRKIVFMAMLLLGFGWGAVTCCYAQHGPTMGWSSWNTYRVNISDSLIMRQANAMVAKGLKKAGYKYVNIDDGYFGGRDRETGQLLIHPTRFPHGLKPVVEHIHRLGLKAGIYSDAGRNTCGSIYDADTIGVGVGLYGHDRQDCDFFFKDLGFDFIKVDYCGGRPHPKGDTLALDEQTRYTEIAEAIRQTGRKDVRLNICRWDFPGTWAADVAASWRMSQDIRPRWSSVKDIIRQNLYLSAYARDGHYNDMDMLEVGRGMTQEEDHTHFAVWCMMSSPLLIGCDLTTIKPATLSLLTDRQLLAVNQDALQLQAYVAKRVGECYVLVKDVKQLNGKERAVALVNLSDQEQTLRLDLRDIDLTGDALTATLPPHATRVFMVKGKRRLQRRLYEAETAFLTDYQELKNHQAALTAIYEEDVRCSGGVKASWLGGRPSNDLVWRDVYVQRAGRYALHLAALTAEPRSMTVSVNGTVVGTLTYTANGEQTVFANLTEGRNEVRLWNAGGRMPDVDYMMVDDRPIAFGKLTVEGRVAPVGIDEVQPRFGWQMTAADNDVQQTSYHLRVSSACDGQGDVWDSGEVANDSSQWVAYQGPALQPNKEYYWQVRVTTNRGTSDWSPVQTWSTGLLKTENWQGDWIGLDSLTDDVVMERHSRIAARHLRKSFTVSKPVRRATVHVCGLGYYILKINGRRIGNYLLCPAPTQYDRAVVYDTYDVSESSLFTPHSSLEVVLAGGYFFPMTQNYQTNVRSAFGMPKVRLNLILEYEDGSSETIATDTTWQVATDGPIRYANLYDGTLIDYRREPTAWQPAQVVDAPCTTLRGNTLSGVRAYATESAVSMTKTADRRFILDFGTNNTGRMFLPSATISDGDTVRVRYAETLTADGKSLYTDNLRQAQNTDYFVGNGKAVTLTTEFLWHGFRYMEVTGLQEKDVRRITRQLMTDDLLSPSTIAVDGSDDGMLNRILDNARRGILSNYKGMPMDCPQRDERMPWLGDRTMGCFGESYMMQNHTLYAKWMQDICDAQRPDGNISDVSPAYWRLYNGNITWPAALPFGLEMLRLQYGDERPLRRHAENVKRFLDFAKRKSGKDGLITYDRYGDWCVPPATLDEVVTKDPARMTDGTLLSSCYYYYICRKAGMDEEAEATKAAINRAFLKDGCYANGTVTANLLPLAMDIVPDSAREAVHRHFMQRVMGDGEAHIDCGVIGISWLMRYLSRAGLGHVAWKIATTKTYPGWGYMVEQGATTIWELWNGNTANPSMNSGNHVMMLGDLVPWCYEYLAGIAPDPQQPGFRHIVMHPDFSISALNGVTATHASPYGLISSRWQRQGSAVEWQVEVPVNCTALLCLPDGSTQTVGSGRHLVKCQMPVQVSVAPFYGGRQAALSLTFDDGLQDQYTLAFPELKRRGLKATFAVIGSKVGGIVHSSQDKVMGISGTPTMTWAMLREMAADGQEISSHGWEHKKVTRLTPEQLRHEVQHNDSVICRETGQWPRTYFYPGNGKDSATVAYCEQGRVGSRTFQIAIGARRDTTWLYRWVDGLMERGEWGVGMTHGIATGYDHFPDPQVLWSLLDYVAARQDSLWVATFHDACAYVRERNAVQLSVSRRAGVTDVAVSCPLPAPVFSHPLTLVIDGCAESVSQGGRQLEIYRKNGKTLVNFDPHGGNIRIK
ncbi:MAG: family 78 glycoside hydrolase catalytic domain [Prevotella sp.]|nr:family 78 glycoside hydrolase catalytic domain [Prevotella sp.]